MDGQIMPDARTYRKCPECKGEDYFRKVTKVYFVSKTKGRKAYSTRPRTHTVHFQCEDSNCGYVETWDYVEEFRKKHSKEIDEKIKEMLNRG